MVPQLIITMNKTPILTSTLFGDNSFNSFTMRPSQWFLMPLVNSCGDQFDTPHALGKWHQEPLTIRYGFSVLYRIVIS